MYKILIFSFKILGTLNPVSEYFHLLDLQSILKFSYWLVEYKSNLFYYTLSLQISTQVFNFQIIVRFIFHQWAHPVFFVQICGNVRFSSRLSKELSTFGFILAIFTFNCFSCSGYLLSFFLRSSFEHFLCSSTFF